MGGSAGSYHERFAAVVDVQLNFGGGDTTARTLLCVADIPMPYQRNIYFILDGGGRVFVATMSHNDARGLPTSN
jgi:hypothetical protein